MDICFVEMLKDVTSFQTDPQKETSPLDEITKKGAA